MPYRKEDEQGTPTGYDWGRLACRVGFFLAFGGGAGAAVMGITYEADCTESVLGMYGSEECDHSKHVMIKEGEDYACRCSNKGIYASRVPTLNSDDEANTKLDEIRFQLDAIEKDMVCVEKTIMVPVVPLNEDQDPRIDEGITQKILRHEERNLSPNSDKFPASPLSSTCTGRCLK